MVVTSRLPRSLVLKSRKELDRLLKTGYRINGRNCTLVWELSEKFHYAILVSKRIGTAARRNRFKRLFREAIRLNRKLLSETVNIALIVRPSENEPEYKDIAKEISAAFKSIGHK